MLESDTGKISLSWETLTDVGFYSRCEGCTALLYIGEVAGILTLNSKQLRFHYSCLNQLGMIIVTFIEATDNVMEGVIERRN